MKQHSYFFSDITLFVRPNVSKIRFKNEVLCIGNNGVGCQTSALEMGFGVIVEVDRLITIHSETDSSKSGCFPLRFL